MTGSIPAGAPAPGTYTLDPERTTIRADVKAMFGLMTVHGTFRLQSGQVSIGADPGASSVQASMPRAATRQAIREGTPMSPGQPAGRRAFPEITFSGQGARSDGDDWVVPGSVTRRVGRLAAIRQSDAGEEEGRESS